MDSCPGTDIDPEILAIVTARPTLTLIFSVSLHDIPLNKWTHVGMSWRKTLHKLLLFINGETFEDYVHENPVLSFKNSGRLLHDIGFREDTGNTIQAYMSDFVIIDKEKNGKNFVEEFFESHPLSKFT